MSGRGRIKKPKDTILSIGKPPLAKSLHRRDVVENVRTVLWQDRMQLRVPRSVPLPKSTEAGASGTAPCWASRDPLCDSTLSRTTSTTCAWLRLSPRRTCATGEEGQGRRSALCLLLFQRSLVTLGAAS